MPDASTAVYPDADDIIYPSVFLFVTIHLACLAALWTGFTARDLVLAAVLYLARMFALTAGYHRYFSHRSFRTGRVFQFVLAFLAQSSGQDGVLWWAAKHREHHAYSDTPRDVHSPRQRGLLYAHIGWIVRRRHQSADYSLVPDLTRFPELVWLNRAKALPPVLLAAACYLAGGGSGLVVGFFWSTVLLYHGTFAINSLAHGWGSQRYPTGDDSRNNFWLALITLGEGWHNNHHYYQSSTRQGFRWWEIDLTFYGLKLLSWIGAVRELRSPPPEVVRGEKRLPRPIVERVARQLAASFPLEPLGERIAAAWALTPGLPSLVELAERWRSWQHLHGIDEARRRLAELIPEPHLPHLPSREEIRARVQELFAATPSLEEIVQRTRQLLAEAVSEHLLRDAAPAGA